MTDKSKEEKKEPTLEELILSIINRYPGSKENEVGIRLMNDIGPAKFSGDEYMKCLSKLLKDKAIIKVECICKSTAWSMYFPIDTKIVVQ